TVNGAGVVSLLPWGWRHTVVVSDWGAAVCTSVLVAAAVVIVPALGAESVTVKVSSASTVVSPATLTVTSLLVSPAAKLTVPVGKIGRASCRERVELAVRAGSG